MSGGRDDDADELGAAKTVAIPGRTSTEPSLLSMMECPKCHVSTPVARFCTDCGAALVARRFCSECGGRLAPGAASCEACGASVA